MFSYKMYFSVIMPMEETDKRHQKIQKKIDLINLEDLPKYI